MFDLHDAAGVMLELAECRKIYGDRYIRLSGVRRHATAGSLRLSFIVNRPKRGAGFRLERQEVARPQRPLHHPRLRRRPARGRAVQRYAEIRSRNRKAIPLDGRSRFRINCSVAARPATEPRQSLEGTMLQARDSIGGRCDRRSRRRPRSIFARSSRRSASAMCSRTGSRAGRPAPVKTRIREIASLLLVDRVRKQIGLTAESADPAHVLHRQSRHRQDHGGAADGRASCTGSATSAGASSSPSPATTSSASTSATPRPRPRRC